MEQAQASRAAQLKAERTTTELQIKLDRRQQQLGEILPWALQLQQQHIQAVRRPAANKQARPDTICQDHEPAALHLAGG